MGINSYQKQVDKSVQPYAKPYWHPLSNLARLIEEVGEVARILNHKFGDKPKKHDELHGELGDELADIIYTCLCIANSQHINLDPHIKNAIEKLEKRDSDRFQRKDDT